MSGTAHPEHHRPRRGRYLAAAVLVAVVAIVLVVVFNHHPGATPRTAPPVAGAPTSGATSAADRCGLTDTDQSVPTTTPAGVRWELYQTVALPFSTAAGPGKIAGDVASCYAHTPVGALIALFQISARHLIAPNWRTVTDQQVIPNPGRATYIKQRAAAPDTGNHPGDYGQFAGYHFVTYTPDTAVIQIVTRFPAGLQMTTGTVVWSSGDWRVQLQPDGGISPNAQQVSDLSGFTPWGGV